MQYSCKIEQDKSHFGNCGFKCAEKKEEEAKEENVDKVMARE